MRSSALVLGLVLGLVACGARDEAAIRPADHANEPNTPIASAKVAGVELSGNPSPEVAKGEAAQEGLHDSCPHTEQGVVGACCEGHGNETDPTSEAPRLVWPEPSTWTKGPESPMRLVTFNVGERQETECYVSVLAGNGGGLQANINRWRNQMGQPPSTSEEMNGLLQIEVLERPAPVLEIEGDFTDMSGEMQQGFMMLVVICALPDQTVFVKMTGPTTEVKAERQHFLAFCESLKMEYADKSEVS